MVRCVKHFRTYLEGNPFTIQTDHNPPTHLDNLKDSHGKLARWALSLQPYQFTIQHRSGKANSNADGLSRDPSAAEVGGVSESWEPEQELLPVTLPQDRKTPEREVYQEVNCNGKEMNKKEVNYGNVVCGQGTTGSKEMNKKEVNDGNVVCGKGTTGSKGSNYGYSLKTKREIKTKKNNGMRTHLRRPSGAWLA